MTAADILNDRAIPFFDEHGIRVDTVLPDRGTEYCGAHEIPSIGVASCGMQPGRIHPCDVLGNRANAKRAVGFPDYNERLSRKRSVAVLNALIYKDTKS
jgi:hypothetical protein